MYFDTVFSTIGSTTRELRIKNPDSQKLIIDKIWLAGGTASQFRLNIDGESVDSRQSVEIEGGDSIFIFADVNVDPTNQSSPLSVRDSILFSAGGSLFKVQLLAWGQDISLFENKVIGSQQWTSAKPYVIYGNLTIDTLATLTVNEGSRIFFHRNGSLKVAGTLVVNGTIASPVIFRGDRLEKMYDDIPGQWTGITILNVSKGNTVANALISNSVNGLTLGEPGGGALNPDLDLSNTSIMHSTVSCLNAFHGKITAWNDIFSHAGKYCINISSGGDYSFIHCSVFNQWDYGYRQTPAVSVSENSDPPVGPSELMDFSFNNSVAYGDMMSELIITPSSSGYTGTYLIDHSLLKLDTLNSSFWSASRFTGVLINRDPRFINISGYDFRPDTLSPLIDNGNPFYSISFPFDIRGESRIKNGKPDIGAFERIAGEHKN